MKLIMIRHGEPDYANDSLTEKGQREAEMLSLRTRSWKVTDFYCSPLGRARKTAEPTLKAAGRTAVIKPWLKEFDVRLTDEVSGRKRIIWDQMPDYLETHPELYDEEGWKSNDMLSAVGAGPYYEMVSRETDALLASYGYVREGRFYTTSPDTKREATVVCFCHLGVTGAILSHLIGASPYVVWQGFYIAPASVTIIGTEERRQGKACFRVQMLGDTSHLREAGEDVSPYGYFTDPFQQ